MSEENGMDLNEQNSTRQIGTPLERAAAEWWEIFRDANPPLSRASHYYSDNRIYAQHAFKAGAAYQRTQSRETLIRLKHLIERLNACASPSDEARQYITAALHVVTKELAG